MLLAAERAGESPAGQRAALLGRFTEEQLASAYAFLVAQGQVYSGGISKAYALSDAFKASLQVWFHELCYCSAWYANSEWRTLQHDITFGRHVYKCIKRLGS